MVLVVSGVTAGYSGRSRGSSVIEEEDHVAGGGWSCVNSVPNGEGKHSRAEMSTGIYEMGNTAVARRQGELSLLPPINDSRAAERDFVRRRHRGCRDAVLRGISTTPICGGDVVPRRTGK